MTHREHIEKIRCKIREFGSAIRRQRQHYGRWCTAKLPHIKNLLSMDMAELANSLMMSVRHAGGTRHQYGNIQTWPQWFRLTVLTLIFISTLGISAVMLWKGLLDQSNALSSESSMYKARFQNVIRETGLLQQRSDRIHTIEDRFWQMLELIPAELEVVHVLDQINGVARESGMKVQSFKPDPEILEEAYATLPVTIELTGTFEAVGLFLEGVSRLKHLVTMDILVDSKDSVPGRLHLVAKLKAYRGEITRSAGSVPGANRDTDVIR